MLEQLHIENVAVIELCDIDFSAGFCVLTGETGAGKSIIIDSINMLLGARSFKQIIRTGAASCFVSSVFGNLSDNTVVKLSSFGVSPDEDGKLLVSRQIFSDGKNICRINGRAVTTSVLRDIGVDLVNIHGQHDSQQLLDPECHINYLDAFAGSEQLISDYAAVYEPLRETENKITALEKDDINRERKIDLLKYQINEIRSAGLQDGEEEELSKRRALLINSEKIIIAASESYGMLCGDESDSANASDLISGAISEISRVSDYDDNLKNALERLNDALYGLEDSIQYIRSVKDMLDFSPQELNDIEMRLSEISTLKRKYGSSIQEILKFCSDCEEELAELENSSVSLEELYLKKEDLIKKTGERAAMLSAHRKEAAKRIEEKICGELEYLDMPKTVFKVEFKDVSDNYFTSNGADDLEFYISANAGETPRPLAQIASGGEMSRIILAIKSVLSESEDIGTLIFDEIDTGVSGRAGSKIAKKLFGISGSKQVLCVTHLAQIACFADSHYYIEKNVESGRTYTKVIKLDRADRAKELARIIAGDAVTEAAMKSSEELISHAEEEKKNILK